MTEMIIKGIWETLYMTVFSTLLAYILGLPLGIFLIVTDKAGLHPMPMLHTILGILINLLRSVPFLILLIAVLPFTRLIVGTSIGSSATVVPLVIAAAPFIARLIESSLKEVDAGIIEAAQSAGASNFQIIFKVLLPEARPSLTIQAAIALTTILGYSAMAGIVGGGGLGDIAIRYGYYRYQKNIMLITVAILVLVVQLFQETGVLIAKRLDRRIRE